MTYQFPQCDSNNCTEEGYYHCRLCGKNWCYEHTCYHLQGAFENEQINKSYAVVCEAEEIDRNTSESRPNFNQPIRQNNGDCIGNLSIEQLQQQLKDCFKRAKSIQRELEQRMIECSGLEYGYRGNGSNSNSRINPRYNGKRRRKRLTKETKVNLALQQLQQFGLTNEQILQIVCPHSPIRQRQQT